MPSNQEDEQFDLGDGIGLEISVLMNAVYVDAQNEHSRNVIESATIQALKLIRQYTKKVEREAKLEERKRVALDNYHGHTFSQYTNYRHKFEKFIEGNERRIKRLESLVKGRD